jgi:hypothetical protein
MRTLLVLLLLALAAGCHKDQVAPIHGPKVEEYGPPPPLK